MTNQKDLQQIMEEISSIRTRGFASGQSGRQTYDEYKHLLPPEVTLVNYPSQSLNCAGYALNQGHTTMEPEKDLDSDYDEVEIPKDAEVYIMYSQGHWVHMGKVVDGETALSKWGWVEPIFRHPLLFYPGIWDNIKYFRRK